MDAITAQLKRPEVWKVSVQLLVLYVVAVAMALGIHEGNRKASASLQEGAQKGSAAAGAAVLIMTALSNFIGVATLVFLARRLHTVPRLAMVGLGLFLSLEKYARRIRSAPQEKRLDVLAAAGCAAGMAAAAFVLMRHCPLK